MSGEDKDKVGKSVGGCRRGDLEGVMMMMLMLEAAMRRVASWLK